MSSTYRVLCLSHDPATAHGRHDTAEEALDAIAAGLEQHPDCDLLVGRYAYALVEVACPASRDQRHTPRCLAHGGPKWAGSDLLRLLVVVYQSPDGVARAAARCNAFRCWTERRLHRLRIELDIPCLDAPPTADSEVAG